MTNNLLKPYPKMKDSGVEWLGEVPEHWEVKPALGVFRPSCERNVGMKETTVLSLSYGRIIVKPPEKLHGLVPESFETYQIVNPGDIILRTTDLQNDHSSLRVGKVMTCGIITSAYLCLKTLKGVLPDYGYQFLNVWDITKGIYGYGSGLRQNLDFVHFRRMPVPLPPLPEQTAIVRYLDYMDHRIRRLIRAKRKLITLLNEQKQVIIHHAVTRGLDPDVPLKDSGVEWLGMVPEHWEVLPIRRCAEKVKTGGTPPSVDERHFSESGFNWFTPGDFSSELYLIESKRKLSVFGEREVKLFPPETVMMIGIGATIGKVAICQNEASCNQQINAIVLSRKMNPEYFTLTLRMLRDHILSCGKFTTLPIINQDETKSLQVPCPSLSEQIEIVEYLFSEIQTLDTTITRAQREIDLLTEYRTRLIADVVTGKVDVREVAAGLPEVDSLGGVDEVEEGLDGVDEELLVEGDAVEAEAKP